MQLLNRPFYFQDEWQSNDGSYPSMATTYRTDENSNTRTGPDDRARLTDTEAVETVGA